MVQALSSNRADQSLHIWILPWTVRRREDSLHSQRRDSQTDVMAVNAVPISDEIWGWVSIGEGLYDLLRGPCRSGMLGDIEMQNFATTMLQDEKDEQYLQGDGRHGEEIQGHRLAKMVAQKGLPRLGGGRRSLRRIRDTVRSEIATPSIFSSP